MNNKVEEQINSFIITIKKEFSSLLIECDYIEDEDYFDIWHNDSSIDNAEKYGNIIGKLIKEKFIDEGIYNVSFGYDYYKSSLKEMEQLNELATISYTSSINNSNSQLINSSILLKNVFLDDTYNHYNKLAEAA